MRCNCRLCAKAQRKDLDIKEWLDWLVHRSDYCLVVNSTRHYFYFDELPTELYVARWGSTKPTKIPRTGLDSWGLRKFIKTTDTEVVHIFDTPFYDYELGEYRRTSTERARIGLML
jgi:hypothetical protein